MALGEVLGEYTASLTSVTFSTEPGGGMKAVINVEGSATGYGQVNGTITMTGNNVGDTAGQVTWAGLSYGDNGEVLGATGQGFWEQLDGEHKWRLRGINMVSNGDVVVSDGVLALDSRSYACTMHGWT